MELLGRVIAAYLRTRVEEGDSVDLPEKGCASYLVAEGPPKRGVFSYSIFTGRVKDGSEHVQGTGNCVPRAPTVTPLSRGRPTVSNGFVGYRGVICADKKVSGPQTFLLHLLL